MNINADQALWNAYECPQVQHTILLDIHNKTTIFLQLLTTSYISILYIQYVPMDNLFYVTSDT